MSSSSKQKQQRGYNRSPLHPVYPFSACLALFTVCFWLAVYTSLPGWFHLLAGLAIASLAVALACYLFALMITWRRDMRQRVVRGQPRDEENLTTKTQERPCRRYLHQQRPRTNNRPSTKAFDAPDARGVPRAETIGLGDRRYNLEHSEAEALTMNELRVPLLDFLWVWLFVAPNAVLLWVTGVAHMLLRQRLVWNGWIRSVDFSASQVAAQLILEQMQIIYYVRTEHRFVSSQKDDTPIGIFVWPDFPTLDEHGELKVYKEMRIELDLDGRSFHQGWLTHQSGEVWPLTAAQAVIMIWFDSISATHVKLHAYANWATNVNAPMHFQQRNSFVTIMYNYFGYEVFPRLAALWRDSGAAKHDFTQITKVFDHGISRGVPAHPRIRELLPHSQLASFIIKVRNFFLNLYNDYKAEFLAMDGEAMFIGTILHSLDHTLMAWNLLDPLWLDVDDPKFGVCAEVGRFVRVGFVDDLPFIAFAKRYKDATHPFYQAVYKHAASINKRLADHMDTCIVK